jgi:hypothetical protein
MTPTRDIGRALGLRPSGRPDSPLQGACFTWALVVPVPLTTIGEVMARYASLNPKLLRAPGGDRFPRCPDLRIVGGRDG